MGVGEFFKSPHFETWGVHIALGCMTEALWASSESFGSMVDGSLPKKGWRALNCLFYPLKYSDKRYLRAFCPPNCSEDEV